MNNIPTHLSPTRQSTKAKVKSDDFPNTTIMLSPRSSFWIGVAIALALTAFVCWVFYMAIVN